MYERRYGLIRTLAPLHVGASAGEEAGNLNLIFRDAYTQTGIIPGSSIRGRFRAEMRRIDDSTNNINTNYWYGGKDQEDAEETDAIQGGLADELDKDEKTTYTESRVKFEYASLIWLPVFCPGQPVVWVSCPRLLRRAASLGLSHAEPEAIKKLVNIGSRRLEGANVRTDTQTHVKLFFNLGFLTLDRADSEQQAIISSFVPSPFRHEVNDEQLVVVDDASMGAIHEMALYRQSRVKLNDTEKTVQHFFNLEALPEGSILIFPIAINHYRSQQYKQSEWSPFWGNEEGTNHTNTNVYFGGLESIGFGRCHVVITELKK